MDEVAGSESKRLRNLAEDAARAAGKLAIQKRNNLLKVEVKGPRDLVTEVDYAVQELITDTIRESYPDHGFLTEEEDDALSESGAIRWIIDPIDGTTNYVHQIPISCISIAAVEVRGAALSTHGTEDFSPQHRVLAGAIYDPFRNELFSGALGQGSSLNGQPMHVSDQLALDGAIVGLDWSRSDHQRQQMLNIVQRILYKAHGVRAIGSAALALAWIAAGRIDAYCNMALRAWDVAAAELLINEAGGHLSNFEGRKWRLNHTGCLATNGHLSTEFLDVVQNRMV